ncbi:MAG: hypothetical protein JNM13_13415 [Hyphomicrobiaceae bacterium]|nr:hypothetical protein [Hyphomicrobiaceae bacterium]
MSIAKKSLAELAQLVTDGMNRQPVTAPVEPKADPALPTWFAIDPDARPRQPTSRYAIKTARGVRWLH